MKGENYSNKEKIIKNHEKRIKMENETINNEDKNLNGGDKNKKKLMVLFGIKVILIVLIVVMIPVVIYEGYKYKVQLDEQNSIPELSNEEIDVTVQAELEELPEIDLPQEEWPEDELFVTKERKDYKSDDTLRLVIPCINMETVVRNGTTREVLNLGAGLYTVAQMPGEGDRNTSIAGHRTGLGTSWNIFYDIDKINLGDYMYLIYKGKVYEYLYKETKIVNPDAIEVLTLQGYPCLTLTSCHPLGSNKERIIVHGELKEIKNIEDTEFADKY